MTAFGNLPRNHIFSDSSNQSRTNLVFWTRKVGLWRSHPLGFQLVKKVFDKFLEDRDFI